MSQDENDPVMDQKMKNLSEMFVEEDLDEELKLWVHNIEGLGWSALRHPLVYRVPYHEVENHRINEFFRYKKKQIQESLDTGNFHKYVFLHERPYRIGAFDDVECDMDDAQYWSILGHIWIDTENFWQNEEDWKSLWSSYRAGRENAMDEDDKKVFNSLPEELTIYRGFTHSVDGLSWTLDREKAEWFARRFSTSERDESHPPKIASTTVHKSQIYAYLGGRGEKEIVVDPAHFVSPVKVEEVKKKGRDES